MTIETANWSDDFIDSRGRDRPFAVVVTNVAEAKEEDILLQTNREDYDPITFSKETNFDDAYLILVEWMGSSRSDGLTLSRIK